MLGFLGLMSGMLVLTAGVSYWISWDIQPQNERLSFAKTVYGDLADLIAKWQSRAANDGSRSPTATPDRDARSQIRQSLEALPQSASPVLSQP